MLCQEHVLFIKELTLPERYSTKQVRVFKISSKKIFGLFYTAIETCYRRSLLKYHFVLNTMYIKGKCFLVLISSALIIFPASSALLNII